MDRDVGAVLRFRDEQFGLLAVVQQIRHHGAQAGNQCEQ